MTDGYKRRFHTHAMATLKAMALLIGCGILFVWAWKAVAVELFELPAARFKHALALEAALVGFALVVGWAGKLPRRLDVAYRLLFNALVPGGTIATTYQPRHRHPTHADALQMAKKVEAAMSSAGFLDVRTEELPVKPVSAVCVPGSRTV